MLVSVWATSYVVTNKVVTHGSSLSGRHAVGDTQSGRHTVIVTELL
jgi:hypothetical protein